MQEKNLDNTIKSYLSSENSLQRGFQINDIIKSYKRRKRLFFIIVFSFIFYSIVSTVNKRIFSPLYLGTFSILISDPISPENRASSGSQAEKLYEGLARNTQTNDVPTLIKLLKSPLVLSETAKEFNLYPNFLSNQIEIVKGGRNTGQGVLEVKIKGSNFKIHKNLVKSVSETYLNAALDFRQKKLNDGLVFLQKQFPKLQSEVIQLEKNLSDFRTRNQVIDPLQESIEIKKELLEIQNLIANLDNSRKRLLDIKEDITQTKLNIIGFSEAVNFSNENQNSDLNFNGVNIASSSQSVLDQGLKIEQELLEAKLKFTENSKIIQSLEKKLKELKPNILKTQKEVLDIALGLNNENRNLALFKEKQIKDKYEKIPQIIKEYNDIFGKLKFSRESLNGLISAQESFQLELAQRSVPWTIISGPNVSDKPINDPLSREIPKGAILGIFVASLVVFIRDLIDHVFYSSGEVKTELKEPILGDIPYVEIFKNQRYSNNENLLDNLTEIKKTGDDLKDKININQRFFYQEAFRMIYTSLRFSKYDDKTNVLTLTSSVPGEGKSLINIILAKTLLDFGEKVLLIDADLRKPQIHSRLGLDNITGLSNFLVDPKKSWENVIQKVDNLNNFNVLTSGIKPPDPTKLLNSERMADLINEIKNSGKYSYVIIDTPPVLGLADFSFVSKYSTGSILLVSINKVNRSLPIESIQKIKSLKTNFLGIITNNINVRQYDNKSSYGNAYYKSYNSYLSEYSSYINIEEDEKDQKDEKDTDKPNESSLFINLYRTIIKKLKLIIDWLDN